MTSKVAKCERIFSNGKESVKLEIDYQTKRYSVSPLDYGCGESMFHYLSVLTISEDLAMVALIRQAIEFAEKELTEKPQEKDVHIRRLTPTECEIQTEEEDKAEKDKPQEKVKEKKKMAMTMWDLRNNANILLLSIPNDAKVIIEWTEEEGR